MTLTTPDRQDAPESPLRGVEFDVVVIGAGFSGMYALYRLRKLGLRMIGFETGDGPGGTWYWNRYPGAQVDIESMVYSYSFDEKLEQEWHWPEHFSPQADLEMYADHVLDRYKIREQIRFETTVNRLRFDEGNNRWHIETDRGDQVVAHFVVAATGSLNATKIRTSPVCRPSKTIGITRPNGPRRASTSAETQVGVIGTGSTGIRAMAERLHVMPRQVVRRLLGGSPPMALWARW